MPLISLPYGTDTLSFDLPQERIKGILCSDLHDLNSEKSQQQIVKEALLNPIGTPRLRDLARNKKKIVILASDHTRPVPSKIIAPLMLEEIRQGNPEAQITFLIATGCHRGTNQSELAEKFGEKLLQTENIYIHDCDDKDNLVNLGSLPSGGELIINRLAAEADLLVSEGFIEPHFFAGFSGGRKSVLPGIASRQTVLYNHNSKFIADQHSRTGILKGNLIHSDMLYAAKAAHLAFICNVIINSKKEVVFATSGDVDLAHKRGCDFLLVHCQAQALPASIVITTNGGYPLEQNIYQAVKGMTAAEATVKKDGIIIMLAKSADGHGGDNFFKTFSNEHSLEKMMKSFLDTPPEKTIIDQWQSQILVRILTKAQVIYVSDAPDEIVRNFHMIPAHSISEALGLADKLLAKKGIINGDITVIPDGVSVIVTS